MVTDQTGPLQGAEPGFRFAQSFPFSLGFLPEGHTRETGRISEMFHFTTSELIQEVE